MKVPCTHCGEIVERLVKTRIVACYPCKQKRIAKRTYKKKVVELSLNDWPWKHLGY